MRKLKAPVFAAMAAVLMFAGTAHAGDFSPTLEFGLSDAKVGANPELTIKVAQDTGEEELAHVTLTVPAGFKLPLDEKITDGDILGTADITIESGPRCAGAGPVSAPATFSDREIYEQDRTDEQADRGVKAVWVVDLKPVTTIPLELTGGKKKGWKFDGDIPANQFTCPAFTFEATIFSKSEADQVPILTNPKAFSPTAHYPTGPGDYEFSATFQSADSPTSLTITQVISITE